MDSPTTQRDAACRLAKQDPVEAARLARKVSDPWFRVQALAYAARFTPGGGALKLAREALQAARGGADEYQRVAATAWPIRALVETRHEGDALAATRKSLSAAGSVTPVGSRAEALITLYQAAFPLGQRARRGFLTALGELAATVDHWRVQRAFRDALAILASEDATLAEELAQVDDEKRAAKLLRAVRENPAEPRSFFW